MANFYNSIKGIMLISCFFFSYFSTSAQTAFLSLDDVTSCPVNDITITLHAEDLLNVGAITLYIGYDTAVLEYDGHGNVHPQFTGIISNPVTVPTTQINIAWSSASGGNLSSGTLLELYFVYKGGTSELTFNPGGDITDVNLLPIPFTTEDGSASIRPYITEHPQHAIVSAGVNAIFSVAATDAETWQWQEYNGSEWQDLQNNAGYQNVDGPELTIIETPQNLDGYWYRCLLTDGGICDAISDSAMLTVLPELTAMLVLPTTGSCPGEEIAIPIQGFALDDVIEFGFYILYTPSVATFTGLANVHPVIEGAIATVYSSPVTHVHIAWTAATGINIPDGVLFELVFDFSQGTTPLVFMEQSYVLNADFNHYTLSTINGQINTYEVPVIEAQPEDITVYAGADANFIVQASGAERYQWYESQDGNSWSMLANQEPYFGAQTPELTIISVPISFHQFRYKCLVSSLHCSLYSESALLSVDTVSWVNNPIPYSNNNLSVIAYQMTGNTLSLTMHSLVAGSLNIRLYNLSGKLIQQSQHNFSNHGRHIITIELARRNAGMILMQGILLDTHGNTHKVVRKMTAW